MSLAAWRQRYAFIAVLDEQRTLGVVTPHGKSALLVFGVG